MAKKTTVAAQTNDEAVQRIKDFALKQERDHLARLRRAEKKPSRRSP